MVDVRLRPGKAADDVAEPAVKAAVEPAGEARDGQVAPAVDTGPDRPSAEVVGALRNDRRWRRPSRWTVLVAGLSVVLLALVVSGALLFQHNRSTDALATDRQAALTAAQQVATDLTSIGADNAAQRIESLTQNSTGGFRTQISTYAAVLQAVLQQSRAGSQGAVSAAAVERIDDSTASVLVTVAATVSNNKLPSAAPVSYRLAVQLQREGDRWLASDVNFVA